MFEAKITNARIPIISFMNFLYLTQAGPPMSRGVIGPVAGNTLSAEARPPRDPPISSLICAFDEYLNTEYADQKVKGEKECDSPHDTVKSSQLRIVVPDRSGYQN